MDDEHKSLVDENGAYHIDKETENLENSYLELMKEIIEKEELMDKSIVEKDLGRDKLQNEMKEALSS
jgi:hypothetical protein